MSRRARASTTDRAPLRARDDDPLARLGYRRARDPGVRRPAPGRSRSRRRSRHRARPPRARRARSGLGVRPERQHARPLAEGHDSPGQPRGERLVIGERRAATDPRDRGHGRRERRVRSRRPRPLGGGHDLEHVALDRPSAPIGERHPPPVPLRSARSACTAVRVAGSSRSAPPAIASASSARTWTREAPLPRRRRDERGGQDLVDAVRAAEPGQARDGEHERVGVAAIELGEPGVDVAVERLDIEVRPHRAKERGPARAVGPDPRAIGQRRERRAAHPADERVAQGPRAADRRR